MPVDQNAIDKLIEEAEADDATHRRRADVCQALALTYRDVGVVLSAGGSMVGTDRRAGRSPFGYGSDATVGLATVVQIAGELIAGTISLLEQGNVYAAAALIRQLVEVEYLGWAFAEDEEEAAAWLRSTKEERLKLWQPRHLRERSGGRFRGADYSGHCERGGHPSPSAAPLLPEHRRPVPLSWWWFDLASHGESAWEYVEVAIEKFGWAEALSGARPAKMELPGLDERQTLRQRIDRWREGEPLLQLFGTFAELSRSEEARPVRSVD